ncbi:MAG: 6-bladed beta-propeller, partial [Candidatus Aureabacteria bacterium]|nr:6-bladed beta-propeller [Candidatus Auribacterota bacterium]
MNLVLTMLGNLLGNEYVHTLCSGSGGSEVNAMHSKARCAWKGLVVVVGVCAAIYGFITLCVKTPFPTSHTFNFLSPVMTPFLMLGEGIYRSGTRHAVLLAVIAAVAGLSCSLIIAARRENRQLSRALLLPALTVAVTAELLWRHIPPAVCYSLLGVAFVLLLIASVSGLGEQLKGLIPPPSRRNRMLSLLAIIALGLVFRAYHLDIRPPGHAHHSAENGMISAQLAHESPWDITRLEKMKKAVGNVRRIVKDEKSLLADFSNKYRGCTPYTVYHFYLVDVSYQIILDWIAFTLWGAHFIIQRALSVVLGVMTIYVLFLLGEELFGTSTGLCAALFMAISPWHNAHSRYSEVAFAITMFCATLTVLCAVRAIQRRSIGWTVALVLNLALDFYVYPSTQFVVFVVIAFWLYSMVFTRQSWVSLLIVGLASLMVVAMLSAPRTNLFGPTKRIHLINSPVNARAGYTVQSYSTMAVNVVKLAKSLLLEATDNDCWFRKQGAILLWPVSILLMGGLAWCLPRLSDWRCALLILWFGIGVFPTIPSPEVLARRITCAAPAIYILAALFTCVLLTSLRQLFGPRLAMARRIVVSVVLALLASSAFATFYYHTMVMEEWYHATHRRIAEIVYENIRDYHLFLQYDVHEIIEPVWIYCEKYLAPGQDNLPITFFKPGELQRIILPPLPTGPAGAMFIVPADAQGNAAIETLKNLYPGGRYELYKLDVEYFDHASGNPLCQSYRIPRELLPNQVAAEAPQKMPEIGPAAHPKGEPRVAFPAQKVWRGGRGPGEYNEPRGIACDGQGNVYVADFRNYRIQKLDRNGLFVIAWGEEGQGNGQFNDPCGVAVGRDGKVCVADTFNGRVQVFDADGKYILSFSGDFFAPRGIAVDGSGRIWVADSGNGLLKLFSEKGERIKVIGKRGSGKGEFDNPNGIAVDQQGNIYVADVGNRRVQVLDGEGNYLSEFKVEGWTQELFDEPYLDVDKKGDIYLTDPPGHRV